MLAYLRHHRTSTEVHCISHHWRECGLRNGITNRSKVTKWSACCAMMVGRTEQCNHYIQNTYIYITDLADFIWFIDFLANSRYLNGRNLYLAWNSEHMLSHVFKGCHQVHPIKPLLELKNLFMNIKWMASGVKEKWQFLKAAICNQICMSWYTDVMQGMHLWLH